jgi:hypothetical protein
MENNLLQDCGMMDPQAHGELEQHSGTEGLGMVFKNNTILIPTSHDESGQSLLPVELTTLAPIPVCTTNGNFYIAGSNVGGTFTQTTGGSDRRGFLGQLDGYCIGNAARLWTVYVLFRLWERAPEDAPL